MPCSPSAAMRLMAHTTSCWLPQIELVVPKRMSGLTGSSGLRETAADIVDDATKLAAAATPDKASAEDTNSRLFVLRSVILKDIRCFLPTRSGNFITSYDGMEAPARAYLSPNPRYFSTG